MKQGNVAFLEGYAKHMDLAKVTMMVRVSFVSVLFIASIVVANHVRVNFLIRVKVV